MRAHACEETTVVSSLLFTSLFTNEEEESLTEEEETLFSRVDASMRTPETMTFVSAGLPLATAPFFFFFPSIATAPESQGAVLSPLDMDGRLNPKSSDMVSAIIQITMLSA